MKKTLLLVVLSLALTSPLAAQHCRRQEFQRFDASPLWAADNDLAADGDRAAVVTVDAGGQDAIDVYGYDGAQWILDQQIPSRFPGIGPVDIRGELLVIGIPFESSVGPNRGAAVVYRKETGGWVEEAILRDPGSQEHDRFGSDVAVEGDVLVVGVPLGDGLAPDTGTAVVFAFDGVNWQATTTLLPSGLAAFDLFGDQVDLHGNRIAIGARRHRDREGAVWVYRWNGSAWMEEQKIQPLDVTTPLQFGRALSLGDDVLAIGAPDWNNPDTGRLAQGKAYVFRHDGSSWVEETKLYASAPRSTENFGRALDLEREAIVVGAPSTTGGTKEGHLYVFRTSGPGRWIEWMYLETSDAINNDWLGFGVSIGPDWVWASAPADAKAAYVYGIDLSKPRVTPCNGEGGNPMCFSSPGGPALGGTWYADVDASGHAGAGLTLVIGYDKSLWGVQTSLGELLVAPEVAGGNYLFRSLVDSGGGIATHALTVPNDPALSGMIAYAQALILGGTAELCNALDLVVGP